MSCHKTHLISLATVLLCGLALSISGNNESDRMVLVEIKAKITDDPMRVTSSWNDTIHFCDWHGVTCSNRHQRVTVLDLQSSQLTGTLSPYIGNLSFLKILDLQNNSFAGVIPPQIGSLHRLQHLLLRNNSFTGEIPANISRCSSLLTLDVYGNRLVGMIPHELGLLARINILFLSRNNFTGAIPSLLGNLSSLVELYTSTNNLIGTIPGSLGEMKSLTILALYGNQLSGAVPYSIFNISVLTMLDLGGNELEGTLPSDIGNTLPYLSFFSIYNNKISGRIPYSLSNSSNLEILQLTANNLQGQVPSLHNLVKLTRLILTNNSLGYDQTDLNFISSLANATNLQWLDIGSNKFNGVLPKTICNFSLLYSLDLDQNNIGGSIPACIENLQQLRFLVASGNKLSGVIPQGIGKLQNLIHLWMYGNHLSGNIPPSIGNLTYLSKMILFDNNLSGQIPSSIGNCSSLIGLYLSYNNLSGTIPSQLFSLPILSIALTLSGNHLSGPLPEEVGQLNSLAGLDISDNMLSGRIPSSLGSCTSLELLFMHENNFQGPIPNAMQTLKGLLELNLAYNNLSGEIPKFLSEFQLQALNLSNNHFEGEVPTLGVFRNVTEFSITGNSGLCGGIPELKLPPCNFTQDTVKTRSRHTKKLTLIFILGSIGVIILVASVVLLYTFWPRKKIREPTAFSDHENFPNLSYQTLFKATNGFSEENLIGSGMFGVVYKGVLEEDGSTVAIKTFNLESQGALKTFMAECDVLRRIRHRNLVKVITACSSIDYQGKEFKALVYEYMTNGSLEDWLHPIEPIKEVENTNKFSKNLDFQQRLDIAMDVASAIGYLHHQYGASIVHCDLKPSNVLLDDDLVAHVSDFGLAKFLSDGIINSHANQSSSMGVRGTIGYTPPEYGLGNEVSTYGDVYSFGILLMEMFTGKRPTDVMFKGGQSLHQFVKEALPEQVLQILDPAVIEDIKSKNGDYNQRKLEATISVLDIALYCSTEIPRERLDINDAYSRLSSIRNSSYEVVHKITKLAAGV